MSSSYDISTAFDSLDDSLVSDVIDLDSWTSSFSTPLPSNEPVRHSTPRPRKCHTRTHGHPRPSAAVAVPPVTTAVVAGPVLSTPAVASTSTQPSVLDKGKGRQTTTPPSETLPRQNLPQNSTSALCGCLNVSTSGLHLDGNQGSTSRVYGVWLKSSTPQKP